MEPFFIWRRVHMYCSFQLMQSILAPNVDGVQPGPRRSLRTFMTSTRTYMWPRDKSKLGVNALLRE